MPKLHPNQGEITIESQITVIETQTIIITVPVARVVLLFYLKI